MEQRRLRLGDILDDYCPRERRVTNHAIVAMIEEDIKQTRCTTCDAEHAYKGARVPRRRKKETPAALYKEVLAGLPAAEESPILTGPAAAPESPAPAAERFAESDGGARDDTLEPVLPMQNPEQDDRPEHHAPQAGGNGDGQPRDFEPAPAAADAAEVGGDEDRTVVDGPVHRRLIRATLPRPEGQKDVRPTPDFTVRRVPVRGANGHGSFRGGQRPRGSGGGQGEPNGNRAQRFHGARSGGSGRQQSRGGGPSGFRGGSGGGKGKRGRGPR